jgi:hypothetical protein
MKNQTFAAYRHVPTDAIHILDLALFSNQQMSNEDGATSLVCKYTNQDSEQELAVVWSGCADEPGVTYIPLEEKENAEIMEAWFNSAGGEFPVLSGEYQFDLDDDLSDHVVVVVSFVELEEKPKTDLEKLLEYKAALYAVPTPELSDPELQDALSSIANMIMKIGRFVNEIAKS